MRVQRTLALTLLFASSSTILGQYDQVDAATWSHIKSTARAAASVAAAPLEASKDAYDDRMDRYEKVADFEAEYWKRRGEAWEKWAQDQGYAPSPTSRRAHPELYEDATVTADGEATGIKDLQQVGKQQSDYWTKYGQSWADWAVKEGYAPPPANNNNNDGSNKAAYVAASSVEGAKDAYDDRMDRYQKIGEFESEYWKRRGDAWGQWAQDQGYAPSPTSQRAHPDQQNTADVLASSTATDATASKDYQQVGQQQSDYWTKYGQSWAQWAVKNGYAPPPPPAEGAKDAYDDRMAGYAAIGNQQAAYWNRYGQSWADWAVKNGFAPSPDSQINHQQQQQQQYQQQQYQYQADPSQQQQEQEGQQPANTQSFVAPPSLDAGVNPNNNGGSRRLDAYDDRMDRYQAVGDFEAEYWKRRGDAWQQWAQDQGYAPSPTSQRAHPDQQNTADSMASAADATTQPPQDGVAGGDNKAGVMGSNHFDGRFMANIVEDFVNEATDHYARAQLGILPFSASASASASAPSNDGLLLLRSGTTGSSGSAANKDTLADDSWVGRSAGHVVNAGERVVNRAGTGIERSWTMAGSRISDAQAAWEAVEAKHPSKDQQDSTTATAGATDIPADVLPAQADPASKPKEQKLRGRKN